MLNSDEIQKRFADLSTDEKQWAIKIGKPVQIMYSDSISELWKILLSISEIGEDFCSYVEIIGRNGFYSRTFDGQTILPLSTDEPIKAAIEMEENALKSKSRLTSVGEHVWEIELF